jgi:lantibiotic modifying enzyme
LIATGLLPGRPSHNLPDTSGFFGVAAPVSFLHLPHWSQNPAGQFRLTNAPACLLNHANSPETTSPVLVLPQLLEGYRQAARALLQARKTLLAPGSPWRRLLERRHTPRIVLRDTLTYALFLSQSLTPGHLRSQHRRRLALRRALLQHGAAGLPSSLLRAELHSLLQLHIPRLIILPGTRTLASSAGRPLAHGFSHTTAARHVIRRIENLSAESLESTHLPALLLAVLQSRASSHSP